MNPTQSPGQQPQPPVEQPVSAPPVAQQAYPQPLAPQSQSVGLAVASLVTGIIGFLTGIFLIGALFGLVALILGIVALSLKHGGKGMSITGIVLGSITILFVAGLVIIGVGMRDAFDNQTMDSYGTSRQY